MRFTEAITDERRKELFKAAQKEYRHPYGVKELDHRGFDYKGNMVHWSSKQVVLNIYEKDNKHRFEIGPEYWHHYVHSYDIGRRMMQNGRHDDNSLGEYIRLHTNITPK